DADPGRLRAIAAAASQAAQPAGSGAGHADGWLDEIEVKELLRAAGIAVPDGRVVASEDECRASLSELGGPVALKLASPGLSHKSEEGALRLDLRTEEEVRGAYRTLSALPAAAGAKVLMEQMAPA